MVIPIESRYGEISFFEIETIEKLKRTFLERRIPITRQDLSADAENYIVQEGDTLDLIAFEEYDSTYWHLIAEANDIINPFELEVGKVLVLPTEEDFSFLR